MTDTLNDHDARLLEQRVRTLEAERDQYRQRLEIVAAMLLQEAINRDWCSDYDAFVDHVNETVGAEVLKHCRQDFVVHFTGYVNITARDGEQATELGSQELSRLEGYSNHGFSFEITDCEGDG